MYVTPLLQVCQKMNDDKTAVLSPEDTLKAINEISEVAAKHNMVVGTLTADQLKN